MLQFPYWAALDMGLNVFRNMDEPINLKAWDVQFHMHKTRPSTRLIQARCFTDLNVNVLSPQEFLGTSESLPWTSTHSSPCVKIEKEAEYTHWRLWDPLYTTEKKRETQQSANMKFMKSLGLTCYECMGAWNKLHDYLSGLRRGSLTACPRGGEVGRWKEGMTRELTERRAYFILFSQDSFCKSGKWELWGVDISLTPPESSCPSSCSSKKIAKGEQTRNLLEEDALNSFLCKYWL